MAKLFFKRLRENSTTGFTSINAYQSNRIFKRDGSVNIERRGLPFWESIHLFHELIHMPWWRFNLTVFLTYLSLNLVFAALYWMVGLEHLVGYMETDNLNEFWEAFFFSTQTISTVGYGRVNPTGMGANMVAAIESLTGLLGFALATGLLYGRFSKPSSRLMYSNQAILAPFQDATALMFRIANKNKSSIIEPEAEVLVSLKDETNVRRFFNLTLQLKKVSYLTLSWTIVHPIDENSPFNGLTEKDMEQLDIEVVATVKGFDTTFGATVYSSHSYKYYEIVHGAKFVTVFHPSDDNRVTILELDKLHHFERVELPIFSRIAAPKLPPGDFS